MSRQRLAGPSLVLALLIASPAGAQAPQFRADIRQTGDAPFEGTMYFGNGKMRIEGVSSGQQMTAIIDGGAGTMLVLMPEDRVYMTMDVGSAPFSAPGASSMDPANPCSSGEVSDCRSLGSETVNGVAARGWEYTRDGERETAWIANELRFPVRTIEADGTTTDMTNVAMGPQPSSLFEPPPGYTAMDVGAMLGGFGAAGRGGRGVPPGAGRGQVPPGAGRGGAGRGQVPPAGRGAPASGAGGVDPAAAAQLTAQLQAMGLPPDQIAMAIAQLGAVGTATNSAPWEQGDGWVIEVTVTASGQNSQTFDEGRGTLSERYSANYQASIPLTYGTPAVGAAVGPAWQLVATLGSARALAEPLVFTGTTQYHSEQNVPAGCPVQDAQRIVTDSRGTGNVRTTDHSSIEIAGAQVRWEISGNLGTHHLLVAAGATAATESTQATTTTTPCPGSTGGTDTSSFTRERTMSIALDLDGLPLPDAPGRMTGSATVPMRFEIGTFNGDLPAQVQWTLRPM